MQQDKRRSMGKLRHLFIGMTLKLAKQDGHRQTTGIEHDPLFRLGSYFFDSSRLVSVAFLKCAVSKFIHAR
jgi:hypothetical protein